MNAIAIVPNGHIITKPVRPSQPAAEADRGMAMLLRQVIDHGIEALSPTDVAALADLAGRSGVSTALVSELRNPNAPAVVRERITGLIGRHVTDGINAEAPVAA